MLNFHDTQEFGFGIIMFDENAHKCHNTYFHNEIYTHQGINQCTLKILTFFKSFFVKLKTIIEQARALVPGMMALFNHTDTRNTTRAWRQSFDNQYALNKTTLDPIFDGSHTQPFQSTCLEHIWQVLFPPIMQLLNLPLSMNSTPLCY